MSTGPVDDWGSGLAEVGPVYPLTGAEGLWAAIALIFVVWWIIASLRMDDLMRVETSENYGNPQDLHDLIAILEGEAPERDA